MIEYSLVKLIHLGALIFWLGPALGSWIVLKVCQHDGIAKEALARLHRAFITTVVIEHVAFAALLVSGAYLAFNFNMQTLPWLQFKLAIVGIVLIPLEVIDVWLANFKIAKIAPKVIAGTASSKEQALYDFYHGTFTKLALVLVPVSVLAIMWLAVSNTV